MDKRQEDVSSRLLVEEILSKSEREMGRFAWEGTFAGYLRMVVDNPTVSRLSHKLVCDAIISQGVEDTSSGVPAYTLFDDRIFGLDEPLDRVVQYFVASARRLETRKRIMLLLGPPASGKSSVVALIKQALEGYTKSDAGAVFAIKGCPMQEDPLHLIPHQLRSQLFDERGIHIEGDLCPRCRYMVRFEYEGRLSEVPVIRVVFSEHEAVGIGYHVASSPNPTDASILVGSVDTGQLQGDRVEVAGKAFRLDGEFNVANRGIIELVEIFKANKHLLTTLLGLAQEQVIKMERFGSIYADEVIVAHSNEGDFNTFASDEHSEALRDRIIAIKIPYNLKVSDEVRIYENMIEGIEAGNVHMPPLTLPVMSVFAVLSRLESPLRQGMSLLDKLRLYDGRMLNNTSLDVVTDIRRQHPNEGMSGISPRYVMNRLSAAATSDEVSCISPLRALDSLWQGLNENVSLEDADRANCISLLKDTVLEYNERAVRAVQRAFKEGFDQSASDLASEYLSHVCSWASGGATNERGMRDMEKHVGVSERGRKKFRLEINHFANTLQHKGLPFDYTSEARLKTAVEDRLFPARRKVVRTLSRPRFARQQVEWRRERSAILNRLINSYGYCAKCADDLIEYVLYILKGGAALKIHKNEGVDWQWDLNAVVTDSSE